MRPEDDEALEPFRTLMRESHLLAPHDIPDLIARHAPAVGLRDPMIYLADLQQQVLVPFPSELPAPEDTRQPAVLGVESTLAGRAYQHVDVIAQDLDTSDLRIWIPLLNGTERLGVLAATIERSVDVQDGGTSGRRLRLFASLVAELVMTKTMYGDAIVRLRRTAPMGLAAEIQWSLLPPLTFTNQRISVAAALEPAYDVAGDSVDYAVDPDAARFAVFDGMGHELASSQLASLVVAAYRNARRAGQTLTQTSSYVDEVVTAAFAGEGFVTGVLAELDLDTGELSWVCAGHPPPLLLRHGRLVRSLEVQPRLPFGLGLDEPAAGDDPLLSSEAGPQMGSEHLEPGDYVLLYTDGVIEARSPRGELFGVERLTDLMLRSLSAGLPASESMRRAVSALLSHQGSSLRDDATMLLAQWQPEHPERVLP
jgi:serine phosphatase RsbU (regulator of sigma subunit)